MEFSCHTWGFNDMTLTDALGSIARAGFRYVDLGTGPHLDVVRLARDPRGAATQVRRALEVFNLGVGDVHVVLPSLSLRDDVRRRKTIDLFKALLPFPIALEAPGVTLSPAAGDDDDDEAFDRLVAALRDVVRAARAATPATHLQVSVAPQLDGLIATPDAAQKLAEQVNGLAITLDWAHMIYQGIDADALTPVLPHTRHVQVRQAARDRLQVPYEMGELDADDVMQALADADYGGMVGVTYLQTEGWHGTVPVDTLGEAAHLRDELREARDRLGL